MPVSGSFVVFLSLFSLLLSVVIIGQQNHLSRCANLLDRLYLSAYNTNALVSRVTGVHDHLVDNTPVSEIITWPSIDKFTLISRGRLVRESTELFGSSRMRELVSGMKNLYADRCVTFDAPPVPAGADTLNLVPMVDWIFFPRT